ncbi:hypothetical protein Rhein_3362 [Rheinheimera sp. A13L]|uniref:hypothetical protein n=1 Tax=Rheinheimera sp. A13L TaxID=506534 RepID=UPI0002124AAD|nr:hypothetical protein [Rheinheimera sp. A13L]EGM76632.1 hypothetical protein Rhein_3362 [Rheinheimera sp. A13L]
MLKHVFALSVVVALSACGGGSGDSTPPTPPVSNLPDLLLTAENYQEVTPVAFAFQEALLQLSHYSYGRIQNLSETDRNQDIICSNGGIRSVDWTGSISRPGQATAGTVITETFRDCLVAEFNEVLNGSAVISVKAESTAANIQLQLNFNGLEISSAPAIVVVDPFELSITESADLYSIKPALINNKLRFNFKGEGIYSLSNTVLNHQLNTKTALYTSSFQTDLTIDDFKSGLKIATSKGFSGYVGEYPHEGAISVTDVKNNKLEVKANYVENSYLANVSFTGASNPGSTHWSSLIEGALWSWPGLSSYYLSEFRADNFAFSGFYHPEKLSNLNVNDTVTLQFSRELAPSQNLNLYLLGNWSTADIPLEYQIKGSQLILFIPEGMKYDQEYRLSYFTITSAKGYTIDVANWDMFKGNNAVKALITASTKVFTKDQYPQLSAANSQSKTGLNLTYSWSEVTNTGLIFSAPDNKETSFYYTGSVPVQKPLIKLTVTDSQGNSASELLQLSPYTQGLNTLYFTSDQGDYIGQGQTVLHQTEGSVVNYLSMFEQWNTIRASIEYSENDQNYNWSLSFSAANGAPLTTGHYTGASRHPFQPFNTPGLDFTGNGRGCNTSRGEFTIHEIAYSGDENSPQLDVLAMDLVQYCEGGPTKIKASIRINSNVLLTF